MYQPVFDQQQSRDQPAHLGRRLCAAAVDIALYVAFYMLAFFLLLGGNNDHEEGMCTLWIPEDFSVYIMCVAVPFAFVVFSYIKWGASIGKILMGLRVVDERTGGPPHYRQFIARVISFEYVYGQMLLLSCSTRNAEWMYVILILLFAAQVMWDHKRRGVHDLIARTVVVQGIPTSEGEETREPIV